MSYGFVEIKNWKRVIAHYSVLKEYMENYIIEKKTLNTQ